MRHFWSAATLAVGLCFLSSAAAPAINAQENGKGVSVRIVRELPAREKRWALIIGIDDYDDKSISALRGAANDAKELAKALQVSAGFDESQIILLTSDAPFERQPRRANILKRLSNLKNLVRKDGLLLVSFSGHGIERGGRAFLIPSDAASTDDVDLLEDTAVSVESVKRQVRAVGVQQVLFLLDACRNDPTSGRAETVNPLTEAYQRGFSFDVQNREVEAFATLYATSVGTRAYEYAEKRQGYFSWAVVEGLSGKAANPLTGEVTLGSLIKYVEERVPKQVRIDLGAKIQKPFAVIEGYKADELVLAIGRTSAPPLAKPIELPRVDSSGERAFWQEAESRKTAAMYEQYLLTYPKGEFAPLARIRIGDLKTAEKEIEANREQAVLLIKQSSEAENQGNFDQAISLATKAIELDPQSARAYNRRGFSLDSKGDYDRAIADFTKAIKINPRIDAYFTNRGVAHRNKKEYDLAIADLTKAIEINPKDGINYAHRGVAYYYKGDYERALTDETKAIEIEPTAKRYRARAETYKAKGDAERARADQQKAYEIDGQQKP